MGVRHKDLHALLFALYGYWLVAINSAAFLLVPLSPASISGSRFALLAAFLSCTRCQSLPFGRAKSSCSESPQPFLASPCPSQRFFPSFAMKGQSTEELNQVQGYSSYLLAIRYHCTALNYLFQLPRQVCGKFPQSFNENQIANFKPKFFICTTAWLWSVAAQGRGEQLCRNRPQSQLGEVCGSHLIKLDRKYL